MARKLGQFLIGWLLDAGLFKTKVQEEEKHAEDLPKEEPARICEENARIVNSMTQEDLLVLFRTVYGEARGEGAEGQISIVHVVLNRVAGNSHYGNTVSTVCLKKYQFSCWLEDDPNLPKMIEATYGEFMKLGIYETVIEALNLWSIGEDITNGATHYHAEYVAPYWAEGKVPCSNKGQHKFYKDID